MSGSMNRVTLIGHLGQDPEVRSTQDGRKIVSLSIATSESWTDKHSGERRERTEWHRVAIFNEGLVEIAEKYLIKGAKVLVEGKLVTRKWTDSAGVERSTTEIHLQPYNGLLTFLDSKKTSEERATGRTREPAVAGSGGREPAMTGNGSAALAPDFDDDIPF